MKKIKNKMFIKIKDLIKQGRNRVYKNINTEMGDLYTNISV